MGKAERLIRRPLRSLLGVDIVPAEKSAAGHLVSLLRSLDIHCVLDVGAHTGEYGRYLRSIGYRGEIVSFEPVEGSFTVLAEAAAPDPAWQTHRMALGSEDTSAAINVTHTTSFSSFLTPSAYALKQFPGESEIERAEVVPVRRLDSVFSDVVGRGQRIFLKMDTQGWDLHVLRGAASCLDQILGIESEVAVQAAYENIPLYVETITYLNERGFEITGLFPVTRDDKMRVIEWDCMLIRSDQVIRRPATPTLVGVFGEKSR